MIRIVALTFITSLICCNNPTESGHNYYDDLSKGTIDRMSLNEKQIINAIIANRMGCDSGIVLIMDSTINWKIDTSRIHSNDTFPLALQQKYNILNSKKDYIGDINFGNSFDYRYLNRSHIDSIFKGDLRAGWEIFHSRYPKSRVGIVSFSKIAINDDSTQAIVGVDWAFGFLGGDDGFILLKKINGNWTVLIYDIVHIS